MRGLTKRFGGGRFGRSEPVVAVDGVDLTVDQGEVFGFLGPNGAGKSTTINMLLDFVRPTDGEVRLFGENVREAGPSVRERVGVLPEGYAFDGALTAREYVEWVVRTKDATDDPTTILRSVGLADAADRSVGGFSTGMRQRLAFGMALVGDPDLLVMDEPSAGLDPNGIRRIRELVRERAADGTTVFFSSHVLPEVEAVCDRVGVMNEGRLVAVDGIDEFRERAEGTPTIRVDCVEPPDPAVVTGDGVQSAELDDSAVVVRCRSSADKLTAVQRVAEHARVTDIRSSGASLESLFAAYTEGGRDAAGTDEASNASDDGDHEREVSV